LPSGHRETLAFLMDHLGRVMEMEGENLVSLACCAVMCGFGGPWLTDVVDDESQPRCCVCADDHAAAEY